ncbi:MAG TPA: ArsR family transcriptional regulator [Ktedonobacteraceae bacterium]|jgi:predicted ArsR family transcriptional regulator|nr:ArsR family transcriptional regulator [Ktedonobacteraceae bacterium]
MSPQPWNQHFFSSTRGRIVLLLRRASYTVDELAQALHLTDNAVRAHLVTLERDGLVCQSGERRGSSKPASLYSLAPGAEHFFPNAYGRLVLLHLLETLTSSISPEQLANMMQRTGQRMATECDAPSGELRARLQHAIDIVNELGGLMELEELPDAYAIQGYSCPLAAVVPGHPEICQLTQAFLSELVGVPVEEQCKRDEAARCRFTTLKSPSGAHLS